MAHSPAKPSNLELIDLMHGPRVDVYVGKSKKHYQLPKNLLCYYSKFFNSCFNGNFKEATTQTLELPEDSIDDFEIIIDYMLHHNVTIPLKTPSDNYHENLHHCLQFIGYSSKFVMGDVATSAIYEPLRQLFIEEGQKRPQGRVIPEGAIETIFRRTPPTSALRTLIIQATLSLGGIDNLKKYEPLIDKLDGFGKVLFKELHESLRSCVWTDPLTGLTRKGMAGGMAGRGVDDDNVSSSEDSLDSVEMQFAIFN